MRVGFDYRRGFFKGQLVGGGRFNIFRANVGVVLRQSN
jgi:hypothetical protein